jgi:LacI family transcriptional regulator
MSRISEVLERIREELARGSHGKANDRFMTVRDLASRYRVSLVTAQRVMRSLREQGLLIADSTNPAFISATALRPISSEAPGTPRRLGLVITNIASPFFSQLCRHIQQEASAMGCQVLTAGSQYDFHREKKAIESFLEIGVEGLLIVPGLDEACQPFYQGLIDRRVPLAFVSRQVEGVAADYVVADSFLGSAAVAGHFVSMGYQSFGYIGFASLLKRDARLSGFRSALLEGDAKLEPERIVNADGGGIDDGVRAMAKLMSGRRRPRAVFAYHDLLAIGALQYCQTHGIAVPGEVAISGFDNLPQGQVTSPALTTVSYPVESIARLAVQCVAERRGDGTAIRPCHHILLAPQLVVRQSTDPSAAPVESAAAADYQVGEIL